MYTRAGATKLECAPMHVHLNELQLSIPPAVRSLPKALVIKNVVMPVSSSEIAPTEEPPIFLTVNSVQELTAYVNLEPLKSNASSGTDDQNFVVVSLNGGHAALDFLKELGLTDEAGNRIPGKILKVMDIVIGITSTAVLEDGDVLSLQVLQAATGKRLLTSNRTQLLRNGGLKVFGHMQPGGGRARERVPVDVSDLDAAKPNDLQVRAKGWSRDHRHKKTFHCTYKTAFFKFRV